jgi:hypothetical protein
VFIETLNITYKTFRISHTVNIQAIPRSDTLLILTTNIPKTQSPSQSAMQKSPRIYFIKIRYIFPVSPVTVIYRSIGNFISLTVGLLGHRSSSLCNILTCALVLFFSALNISLAVCFTAYNLCSSLKVTGHISKVLLICLCRGSMQPLQMNSEIVP